MSNNVITQNEDLIRLDNAAGAANNSEFYLTYQKLFSGRTDVIGIANQSVQVATEEVVSSKIREHLSGKSRIGFYNLLPDGTCPWAVVEFENHDKPTDLKDPATRSLQFMEHMKSVGIPCYRELSKHPNGKCFHVWIFFDKPISAKKVHLTLRQFIQNVMGIDTEVFPKGYNTNSLGNFVRVPLFGAAEDALGWGVPKARTVFVDAKGKAYPDQQTFVSSIQRTTEAQLDELIAQYKLDITEKEQSQQTVLINGLDKVRKECSFMQYCEEHAADLTEPLWYAWLTNAARFTGGREYIHRYSKKYPGYSIIETDKKIAHAMADTGPMTHETIIKLGYACDCPSKYRSPLSHAVYMDIPQEVARIKAIADGDDKIQAIRNLLKYFHSHLDSLEQNVYQEFIKKELGLKSAAFKSAADGASTSSVGELDYSKDLRQVLSECKEIGKTYEESGEIIYAWLQKHGVKFYRDREHVHYLFADGRLLTISKNDPQFESYFFGITGTTTATKDGEVYVKVLQALAERDGNSISMDTWLHTNLAKGIIYFNLNNDKQELVRISASGVSIIENGSGDEEVMLRESEKILPINYVPMADEAEYKRGLGKLKSLVVDNLACKETDRIFCTS